MRKLFAVLGLAAAVSIAPGLARADDDDWNDDAEAQQQQQVNPEVFQQNLSPYGQWDNDSTYGEVFYPNVGAGWRPYVYGRWVWTDYGWMWDSEEPFGWAVYHYGRWWWNPWRHAWGWVPGYEWAPAWVVWRFGGVSVGWAPLYVGYDAWSDDYPIFYDHWVYVPCEHFYGGPVYSYVYAPTYVRTVFYNTQPAYGYVGTVSYGPPTTYVAAHSATPITTAQVVHSSNPAAAGGMHTGNTVPVYTAPGTHAYDPHNPSAPQYRGPGAARQPVTAPPSVVSRSPNFIPPARGNGRGPGMAPNQGNGVTSTPGHGRGPGTAPNQGGARPGQGGPSYRGPNEPGSRPPGGNPNPGATRPPGYDNRPGGFDNRPGNFGQPNRPGYPVGPTPPGRPGQPQQPGPQQRPQNIRPGGRPQQPGQPGGPNLGGPHVDNLPSYEPRRRPEMYHSPNPPVRSDFNRGQPSVASYGGYGGNSGGYRAPQPSFGGNSGGYRAPQPSFGGSRGGGFSGGGFRGAPQPSFSAPQHRGGGSPAPAPAPAARRGHR